MPGRRRDSRFRLSLPWAGTLRVPNDVMIERYSDDEVWVVSTTPAHRDERLTLDLTGSGLAETIRVRVVDSVPVVVEGVVRHRLHLAISERV